VWCLDAHGQSWLVSSRKFQTLNTQWICLVSSSLKFLCLLCEARLHIHVPRISQICLHFVRQENIFLPFSQHSNASTILFSQATDNHVRFLLISFGCIIYTYMNPGGMPSLSPVFFSFFRLIEPILDNKVVSQMFNVYLYVAFCHFLNSGKWIFETMNCSSAWTVTSSLGWWWIIIDAW